MRDFQQPGMDHVVHGGSGPLVTGRTAITLVNGPNGTVDIGGAGYIGLVGPTGAFTISGFTGGYDGRRLVMTLEVAFGLTLVNDAVAAVADRILTGLGVDFDLTGVIGATLELIYDIALLRWCLFR